MRGGGTSCAFRHAVVAQHFNLLRDLVDVRNALRLLLPLTLPILETKLWPWHHFSRLDVQANLLDDFLFEGETMVTLASRDDDTPQTPPHLLVNTTDLGSGAAIGFSRHGVLVLGPTAAALVPLALPTALEHGRLARLVAIAGAFPAAFPTTKVVFGATEGTHPLAGEVFALSDGGVFDNSGVLPLQVMHRLSSRAASYAEVLSLQPHNLPQRPLPSQRLLQRIQERMQDEKTREGRDRWRVNLILASDGGHVFQESQGDTMDALHTVVRAVTVSGLHDAKPLAGPSEDDAPVLWLRPHALLDAFQRPKFVPDALLARLVPWVPSAQFSEPSSTASSGFFATLTRLFDRRGTHDEAHGGRSPWTVCPENQAGTPRRLDEFSPTQRDHFRRVVTTDIQQAVQVFEASDTLQDQYTAREADALFRLGMYVVFHHHDAIMRSLTRGAPLPPRSNGS